MAGYVGNFGVVAGSADAARARRDAISKELRRCGLPAHGETEPAQQRVFTGFAFDGRRGEIAVTAGRRARFKLALDGLLRRTRVSPRAMGVVIGHCTWAMMSRRETLAMLGSVYRFAHGRSDTPVVMWASVRKELEWLRATIPLWTTSLRMPWCSEVTCSDASELGSGVCVRQAAPDEIHSIGVQTEK